MNKALEVIIGFALIIGFGAYIYKSSVYECKNCKYTYKPSFGKWSSGINWGLKKYMKCPECGNRNLHKRVRNTKHKDYLD